MDEGVESPPGKNDSYAVSVLSLISAHYHGYQMDKRVESLPRRHSSYLPPATMCDHQLTTSTSFNRPAVDQDHHHQDCHHIHRLHNHPLTATLSHRTCRGW